MERPNAWKQYDEASLNELKEISRKYRVFLDNGKTERECVTETVAAAKAAGYIDLNDAIKAAGCNKIAYAHHEDDVVETMMLSLFYEGRLHTFSPVTHLDKTDLTVIRPLIYMRESEVIGFVHKYQIPVVKSPCPADGHTRREYVKELLGKLNRENPGVKDRIFTAIQKGNMEGWTDYFGSH